MTHQTRCQFQQTSISHMEEMCKSICLESRGKIIKSLVIMDFKMKFEVRSARESQVQHFGKRGIGWHGMAVIFYLLDENGEAQRNIVYLDQILEDSNKQDAGTVIALLEAGLSAIHRQLPFLSEITLLSDNAKCYQNHFLTMMISIFNIKYQGDLLITSFVHSETQDGKSLLDAHFATVNRHLLQFMKTWRRNRITKINTPNGLAFALSFKSGVKNSMVQLLKVNRSTVDEILETFKKVATQCSDFYTRANHIKFEKVPKLANNEDEDWTQVHTIKKAKFNFEVMAFTRIKPEVKFAVDMNTDKVSTDEKTLQLIQSQLQVCEDEDVFDNIEESNPIPTTNDTDSESGENQTDKNTNQNDGSDLTFINLQQGNEAQLLSKVTTVESHYDKHNTVSNQSNSDSDSEYDIEEDNLDNSSSDDEICNWYLDDNDSRNYGPCKDAFFVSSNMITGVELIKCLELGTV